MEQMEEELLGRLKNSQQLEQSEHGKLEEAIKKSHEACEERRKNQQQIKKPRPKQYVKMRNSLSTNPAEQANGNQL